MEKMGVVNKKHPPGGGCRRRDCREGRSILFALHITDGVFKVRMRGAHIRCFPLAAGYYSSLFFPVHQ